MIPRSILPLPWQYQPPDLLVVEDTASRNLLCGEAEAIVSLPRPEVQAPPEIFYNDSEARKYTASSRIIEIQVRISERALELLALPNDGVPKMLLDIRCGSGLSGETLTEHGHHWIGCDISKSMLGDELAFFLSLMDNLVYSLVVIFQSRCLATTSTFSQLLQHNLSHLAYYVYIVLTHVPGLRPAPRSY